MISLEQEFNFLMEEVIEKIISKRDKEYSTYEAEDLIEKVRSVMSQGDSSRYGEGCPAGHTGYDCGWSSSMGYHCS